MARVSTLVVIVAATAVLLSLVWRVPCIFTVAVAATLVLAGHLVTADDDLRGGWSNPDGIEPFLRRELLAKVVAFVVLWAMAFVPAIRALGQ